MVLIQNWPFSTFFFRQYRPGNCVLRYSRTRKHLSKLWKQEVLKLEKLRFLQRGYPWFWSKINHLSIFFFLGIIDQENVLYNILERKNASLGYKKRKFKTWKNCDFCKGVNPWFWSKISHFSIFFLGIIEQENVFYDILEQKNAFLGYKNRKFKSGKNCDFCKGVNPWFWFKIGHFSIFCF